MELLVALLWCFTRIFTSDFNLWTQVGAYAFVFIAVLVFFIDLDWKIIPDLLTIPSIILGLVFSPFNEFLGNSGALQNGMASLVAGASGGFFVFVMSMIGKIALGKVGMGMGDLKYSIFIGVFLGFKCLVLSIVIAGLVGGTMVFIGLILKKIKWGEYIPFGPFLTLGSILSLFWSQVGIFRF